MVELLSYKNKTINYRSVGKGQAVILLHGFLENLTMWQNVEKELSKRNRVISIDLLGHGKTGNLGYIHGMEEQAEMVYAVLKHLRLRKFIFIGHSMGGYVSLAFAEKFPDTIKGICLMNSTASADSPDKKINRDRAIEAVKQNHKTFVRIAIPNLFAEDNRIEFKKAIEEITNEALTLTPQGIIASLEGMKIRKERTEVLKKLHSKKLFIIGKKDPVLDYRSLIKQVKKTHSTMVELSGGHMSHVENKLALMRSLKDFVKRCN